MCFRLVFDGYSVQHWLFHRTPFKNKKYRNRSGIPLYFGVRRRAQVKTHKSASDGHVGSGKPEDRC